MTYISFFWKPIFKDIVFDIDGNTLMVRIFAQNPFEDDIKSVTTEGNQDKSTGSEESFSLFEIKRDERMDDFQEIFNPTGIGLIYCLLWIVCFSLINAFYIYRQVSLHICILGKCTSQL